MADKFVDITRYAKFYCAPLRGFCSPYTWFSVPSAVTFLTLFWGSCNSLQPIHP